MNSILRTGLPWLLVAGVLVVAPATVRAGTVYRCQQNDGPVHFSTTRVSSSCVAVATYPAVKGVGSAIADGHTHAIFRQMIDGVARYSTRPPSDGPAAIVVLTYISRCYACAEDGAIDVERIPLDLTAFRAEIADAAMRNDLDPSWLRAVVHAESAFDANALSTKGAQGLMQLMPSTADRFGVRDAFVPADNIRAGAAYLAWLLQRYSGDTGLATAAYNAGENAVDRYHGVPPFAETRRYVRRVLALTARYRRVADG